MTLCQLPLAVRSLPLCVLLLVSGLCLLPSAFGQSGTATLSGTVADQNGAAIPGANVTVKNINTALQRQTITNSEGYFTIPLLPPSTFTVTVESKGFAPVQVNDVVLNIADRKALQIRLKAGDISAAVTIQSDAVTLNTTDGS